MLLQPAAALPVVDPEAPSINPDNSGYRQVAEKISAHFTYKESRYPGADEPFFTQRCEDPNGAMRKYVEECVPEGKVVPIDAESHTCGYDSLATVARISYFGDLTLPQDLPGLEEAQALLDKLRQDNAEGTYADVQEVASVAHCLEYRKWGPEKTYVLVRVQAVYAKRKPDAKMKFSVTPFQPKAHASDFLLAEDKSAHFSAEQLLQAVRDQLSAGAHVVVLYERVNNKASPSSPERAARHIEVLRPR